MSPGRQARTDGIGPLHRLWASVVADRSSPTGVIALVHYPPGPPELLDGVPGIDLDDQEDCVLNR
jgi:hypothetical protein